MKKERDCGFQGKFSSKSDVWSFGVTLWEMWTFAREQPYCDLSDEQVLDNCSNCYHSNALSRRLQQPSGCQRELYDFMRQCWSVTPNQRPSFHEIYMFLVHKNQGYDPTLEKPQPVVAPDDDDVDNDDVSCCSSSDSSDRESQTDNEREHSDTERGLIV